MNATVQQKQTTQKTKLFLDANIKNGMLKHLPPPRPSSAFPTDPVIPLI